MCILSLLAVLVSYNLRTQFTKTLINNECCVSKSCVSSMIILVKQIKYFFNNNCEKIFILSLLCDLAILPILHLGYFEDILPAQIWCRPQLRRFLPSFICCYLFSKWNIYFFILVFSDRRIFSVSFFSCILPCLLLSILPKFWPRKVIIFHRTKIEQILILRFSIVKNCK